MAQTPEIQQGAGCFLASVAFNKRAPFLSIWAKKTIYQKNLIFFIMSTFTEILVLIKTAFQNDVKKNSIKIILKTLSFLKCNVVIWAKKDFQNNLKFFLEILIFSEIWTKNDF